MKLVDVHMITIPNQNQQWKQQCLDSLVGHPVVLHEVDGVFGDIRESRRRGFMQGTSPYVSFVDPDDFVGADAFRRCIVELNKYPNICGAYTLSNQITVDDDGNDIRTELLHPFRQWPLPQRGWLLEIHQLVVMRRECVQYVYDHFYDEIPKMHHTEVWMYWNMAMRAPWRAVDLVGYNWRVHGAGAHKMTTKAEMETAKRTAKYVSDIRRTLFA